MRVKVRALLPIQLLGNRGSDAACQESQTKSKMPLAGWICRVSCYIQVINIHYSILESVMFFKCLLLIESTLYFHLSSPDQDAKCNLAVCQIFCLLQIGWVLLSLVFLSSLWTLL